MQDQKFISNDKNPFTELSELRLQMISAEQDFDLKCRLRFGKMHWEYKDRQYEVGVSRAFLRLTLEGCETLLGNSLGESLLETVIEEDSLETRTFVGTEVSLGAGLDSGVNLKANASMNADAGIVRTRSLKQTKTYLPVSTLPNDSWEIKTKTVTGQSDTVIEGTAIAGASLCALRRKNGGNRVSVLGEVQINKSDIRVSAKGGNSLQKILVEWQNKDAIVSQILKKALQRDASANRAATYSSTMVISRSECLEE